MAVTDATVVRADQAHGAGGLVVIAAADGARYLYAHTGRTLVRRGAKVRAGHALARSARGPRPAGAGAGVHFEVRPGPRGTSPVDPTPWLGRWCR